MTAAAETRRPTGLAAVLGPVTVEVASALNSNLWFRPCERILRGRFAIENVPHGSTPDELAQIFRGNPLPGLYITVDPSRRTAEVRDPMGDPQRKDQLAEVVRRIKAARVVMAWNEEPTFEKTDRRENLSDTDIKTWLYWMRRAVDSGHAEVVHGSLPRLVEIMKLPGRTAMLPSQTAKGAPRFYEDLETE